MAASSYSSTAPARASCSRRAAAAKPDAGRAVGARPSPRAWRYLRPTDSAPRRVRPMLTPITMYGSTWCSDCKRAKNFLGEQRIPYTFVDVEQDAEGLRFVEQANDGKHVIPTVKFGDDSLLVEPSNAELAAKLGLQTSARA